MVMDFITLCCGLEQNSLSMQKESPYFTGNRYLQNHQANQPKTSGRAVANLWRSIANPQRCCTCSELTPRRRRSACRIQTRSWHRCIPRSVAREFLPTDAWARASFPCLVVIFIARRIALRRVHPAFRATHRRNAVPADLWRRACTQEDSLRFPGRAARRAPHLCRNIPPSPWTTPAPCPAPASLLQAAACGRCLPLPPLPVLANNVLQMRASTAQSFLYLMAAGRIIAAQKQIFMLSLGGFWGSSPSAAAEARQQAGLMLIWIEDDMWPA